MRGCPSVGNLQQCVAHEDASWCQPKDRFCKQLIGDETGSKQFRCDPATQRHATENSMELHHIVGISVMATFLFCIFAVLAVACMLRRHRADLWSYYTGYNSLPNDYIEPLTQFS